MSRQHDLRTARLLRSRLSTLSGRRYIRNLQMENLESRVVLSGLPELAATAPEPPVDLPPAEIELEGAEASASVNSVAVAPVPTIPTEPSSIAPQPVSLDDASIDAQAVDSLFAQTASPSEFTVPAASDATLAASNLVLNTGGSEPVLAAAPTGDGDTPNPDEPTPVPPPPVTPPPVTPPPVTPPPPVTSPPLVPPRIVDFQGEGQSGYWLLQGSVTDDKDPAGLTVYFGGLLAGRTATVDRFGTFELIVALGSGIVGYVNAYTIDRDGLRSDTVLLRIV